MSVKDILARLLAIIAGAALFVGAFVFSVFLFAVAVVLGAAVAGYFLWKTRHVRRQLRERHDSRDVIEGTVLSSREVGGTEPVERRPGR